MKPTPLPRWLTGLALAIAAGAAAAGPAPNETWRIESARTAPWTRPGPVAPRDLTGEVFRVEGSTLQGPGGWACTGAAHQFLLVPAAGLFQGNLPAPAEAAARALHLPARPLLTQRINCRNGSVDLHHLDAERAVIAWDNQVLNLRRAAGDNTPLATAAALMQAHFSGDMGFSKGSVDAKAAWLSTTLQRRIAAWLAKPQSPDEVPDIDGDPFTFSQEYPDQYELAPARIKGAQAQVPVRFRLEKSRWKLTLLLRQEAGHWRVDDVLYDDGSRLTNTLPR